MVNLTALRALDIITISTNQISDKLNNKTKLYGFPNDILDMFLPWLQEKYQVSNSLISDSDIPTVWDGGCEAELSGHHQVGGGRQELPRA